MTLYKQVNGKQVPLTEDEEKLLRLSWETERKRQLTDGLQERIKCQVGDLFQLLELLWQGIDEGKIPGKDTAFYSCIATAKVKAEEELLQEIGLTKEEFDTARQEIQEKEGVANETL